MSNKKREYLHRLFDEPGPVTKPAGADIYGGVRCRWPPGDLAELHPFPPLAEPRLPPHSDDWSLVSGSIHRGAGAGSRLSWRFAEYGPAVVGAGFALATMARVSHLSGDTVSSDSPTRGPAPFAHTAFVVEIVTVVVFVVAGVCCLARSAWDGTDRCHPHRFAVTHT